MPLIRNGFISNISIYCNSLILEYISIQQKPFKMQPKQQVFGKFVEILGFFPFDLSLSRAFSIESYAVAVLCCAVC